MFYVHNVPGRVRIISEVIKKNPRAADEVRKWLSTLSGIGTADINLTTGSILVHYNTKTVNASDIVNLLERKGYFDPTKAISNDEYLKNGLSKAGAIVLKSIVEPFIGSAIGLL
ncbi:MAG: HMA2 domain-containing protein [Thermodesulfovibrionales bacterium]